MALPHSTPKGARTHREGNRFSGDNTPPLPHIHILKRKKRALLQSRRPLPRVPPPRAHRHLVPLLVLQEMRARMEAEAAADVREQALREAYQDLLAQEARFRQNLAREEDRLYGLIVQWVAEGPCDTYNVYSSARGHSERTRRGGDYAVPSDFMW